MRKSLIFGVLLAVLCSTPLLAGPFMQMPSGGGVSDEGYNATTWDGVTDIAPSKNAVRDEVELLVLGTASFSTLTGGTNAVPAAMLVGTGSSLGYTGTGTINASTLEAHAASYFMVSTALSDAAYDAGTWDADATHAPSKNAVRDKIEALAAPAFSSVTAGTNAAALVMGTGGSLTVSGTGTINATTLETHAAAYFEPHTAALTTLGGLTAVEKKIIIGSAAPAFSVSAYTMPDAIVAGDILYGSATNVVTAIAAGTQNYILAMGASLPAWTTTLTGHTISPTILNLPASAADAGTTAGRIRHNTTTTTVAGGTVNWFDSASHVRTLVDLDTAPAAWTDTYAVTWNVSGKHFVLSAPAGYPTFDLISSGTNVNALVIGTGGTLGFTSTGTINANRYNGTAVIAAGDISTAIARLAGPTFTGLVTVPAYGSGTAGLVINATQVQATGAQLNYLAGATGTTGTNTTNVVFSTSPTLVTPTLGAATATSINKMAITAPATSSTLAVAEGKTFTCSNTLTLTGTDSSSLAIGTGGTLGTAAYTAATAYQAADPDLTALAGVTFAQGDLLYGTGTGAVAALTKSASATRYLANTGTSNNPAWAQVALATGVSGDLPVTNLNSGTGASVSTYWRGDGSWSSPSGAGDVVGPSSATDNALARFDSTTGKLLQNSVVTVADTTGDMAGVGTLSAGAAGFTVDADGDTAGKSFTVAKASGYAGSALLYEATTTETNGTGWLGPTSQGATDLYLRLPGTSPTAGQVMSFAAPASSEGKNVAAPTWVIPALSASYANQVTLNTLTAGGQLYVSAGNTVSSTTVTTRYSVPLVGDGSNAPTTVSGLGTAGYVLTSGGAGTPPTWANPYPIGAASGGTGIANNAASTLTISGNFATTLTVTGTTALTLPTSGTLAILGANTFTGAQTLRLGTTASGTAPLYFTTGGALLTTPVGGAMEISNSGDLIYYTIATGPARKTLAFLDSNITGTAANVSGTPALPNGTTTTTQSAADNSTKLATTAYVDTGLGLKATLAGAVPTGVWDFGGATSVELPNGNNPTTDAAGEVAVDVNNYALEVFAATASRLIPTVYTKELTIPEPDKQQLILDAWPVFRVDATAFPFGITVTSCYVTLSADAAYVAVFEEWTGDPPAQTADIETVTTGAGDSYMEDTTPANPTIEADNYVYVDLPTTDVPMVQVQISYTVNEGN